MEQPKFTFLRAYIEKVMDDNGFAELSPASRDKFIPTLAAEAERRIGLALFPLLSEQAVKQLGDLIVDEKTTAEDLMAFWQKAVPNFSEVVDKTLDAFAVEFKQNLK